MERLLRHIMQMHQEDRSSTNLAIRNVVVSLPDAHADALLKAYTDLSRILDEAQFKILVYGGASSWSRGYTEPLENMLYHLGRNFRFIKGGLTLVDLRSVEWLIKKGIVGLLARVIVENLEYEHLYRASMVNARPWAIAIECAGYLARVALFNPSLAMLGTKWVRSMRRAIAAVERSEFWDSTATALKDRLDLPDQFNSLYFLESTTYMMLPCLAPEDFGTVKWPPEDIIILVRLLLKIRRCFNTRVVHPPSSTLETVRINNNTLRVALNHLALYVRDDRTNAERVLSNSPNGTFLGFPYRELVASALTERDLLEESCSTQPAGLFLMTTQADILSLIYRTTEQLGDQRLTLLLEAFRKERLLTWLGQQMALVSPSDLSAAEYTEYAVYSQSKALYNALAMCQAIVKDGTQLGVPGLAREFVDAKMFFFTEKLTHPQRSSGCRHAEGADGDCMSHLFTSVMCDLFRACRTSLDAETSPRLLVRITDELRLIAARVSMRRTGLQSSSGVVAIWEDLLAETSFAPGANVAADPMHVCANVGCDTPEGFGQICSRCKERSYCSRICQKEDWQSHKAACRGSNSQA